MTRPPTLAVIGASLAGAKAAEGARHAVGGTEAYTRLPYFFSDQYDLGMEYVGYGDAGDAVDDLRAIVEAGAPIDARRLADPHVPLAELR